MLEVIQTQAYLIFYLCVIFTHQLHPQRMFACLETLQSSNAPSTPCLATPSSHPPSTRLT
ncbi:hypothetical protein BDU57DRAFT_511123 [Ampelomyces quisqualis]|uniref:Uncharacterized protein n=1 Tax=Ampelomyces quisqualis TaxID=50730 RepID=A0A6A5R841_AMPQU|nr:hypothetical protein BDU57DRAFT_511123 [Ampelomyces quisqualis]